MEIIYLLIGLIIGGLVGFLFSRLKSGSNEEMMELRQTGIRLENEGTFKDEVIADLKEQIHKYEENLQTEKIKTENLIKEVSSSNAMNENFRERLTNQKTEIEELQKKFTAEFKNLANQIFEEKTAKFTEQNKTNLDTILEPLKEKIKTFEEKVDQSYKEEFKERISLKTEIKHLIDLNKQLSDDANNLASALKGESKTQGDWGEFHLEKILEKSGLQKDIHYRTQTGLRDQQGLLKKPDFIIDLPENKQIIIDSKVSLSAYEGFYNSEVEEEKESFLKNHISSIKNHIKDLSSKNYQDLYGVNTPDYVLMYIPIEGAFALASAQDDKLFLEALEKNIVIVTTSTLLATMKTVSFIWKQENQKKNVLEIARQGGELYDKFVNFTDDLIKIGKQMDQAKNSYADAMNKLSDGKGNLVGKAEKIRKLGIKTSKKMNPTLVNRSIEE